MAENISTVRGSLFTFPNRKQRLTSTSDLLHYYKS